MKRRLPRIVAVCALVLVAATGTVFFIATTDAGARWTLARIDAALGGNLTWAAAEGTLLGGMRLADVALDDGSSLVQIERLEFAWQPWRLFDGSLVLDSVDLLGLRHQTRVSGEPLTEAALKALLFELPVAVELRAFRATDMVLTSVDSTMTTFDSITGAAALDGSGLTLTMLDVQQGDTRVRGDMRLTRDLALTGTVAWEMPYASQTYAGSLTAGGTLREPELTHELLQPLRMSSRGTLVAGIFADDAVSFDLRHEFPLQTLAAFAQADVQLQASVRTAGTPERMDIDGTAHANASAAVPAVAPLDLGFALTYGDSALAIDTATLASKQIDLQGSGLLQLDPLALRFDWNLDALNAGDSFPQLQLEGVSGTGSLQLADDGGAIAGTLELNALAGTLNGYPLSIDGRVSAAGDGSATLELKAANGANTFDVAGTVSSGLALAWNVQAPELGTLWQGLSGELHGSGNVSGSVETPEVNGMLNGGLRLVRDADVLELQSLALAADYAAAGNAVNLVLGTFTRTMDGVTNVLLESGEIALTGKPEAHELNASLTAPEDAVQLSLQGAATGGNWSGTLQDVTLDSRAGDWRLDAPAALAYTAGAWTVAENCWTYLDTRVCLQGGRPAGQGIDAELALTSLPLAWLNPAAEAPASKPAALQQLQDAFAAQLPNGVRIEGELDAQVSLRNFIDGQWSSLDAALQPRDLVAQITQQVEDDDDAAPLVQRFGLDVTRAELRSGGNSWAGAIDIGVTHEEEGASEAQGTLRGSGELAADGSISGSADFAFGDLGWLEFIAPAVRAPAGVLNGRVGVSGTRARPQLQANMELNDGSFELPLYGLDIRDASFELATDAGNVLRLIGSAQSGEGLLQVSAEVSNPLQAERSIMAEVNGTDFLAFATDAATVKVSPQLSGSFADDLLTVNGSIEVADTEVDLEEVFGAGGDNAVSVSRDVVIVNGEQGSATATQDEALRVAANIDIRLGANVHVSGYDLDADLNGQLRVEQAPGRPLLVYGELGIPEGRYEIYNQELNARDGRLVFFGNPANPMVDVRAFRETESGEVGVLLTGNLDSIQGRLYSTPTLPDREILSLLVTGKSSSSTNAEDGDAILGAVASFGIGRGEGFTQRVGDTLGLDTLTVDSGATLEDSALGLGKYLTPDLLMRYKLGLFDRQSVLGIEYSLSERLKLEVETGISQSVDLNYTIEKD